jgi:hypothetical protein
MTTLYAVPLTDLDSVWRTPEGAALVETALDDGGVGDAEIVTVHGADAVVLGGDEPRIAALVAGFVGTPLPAPAARTARVFANDGNGWRRVTTPPEVPELPIEQPEGGGRTCRPRRGGPERASFAHASR